ncbi:MAG: acetyl-CoA C-acetyltransferase [Rhodobacteraceae bacterium]|nr:acetyl-CoA C-acetyltransferase [Paracoccaceae bacterium]
MTEAYIYDAVRTPRGRGKPDGALREVRSVRLSADLLNALLARNTGTGDCVDDVLWGTVTQVGEQGGCLARAAVLMSDLPDTVPGISINRFCASGLDAVNLAAALVRSEAGGCYIAGGVEMMSRVPMGADGAALAVDPELTLNHCLVPQGIAADIIATRFGFTRNDCDAYAARSHQRAGTAWQEGRFTRSVIPVKDSIGMTLLDRDEHIRPETTADTLAGLAPAFREIGENTPGFDAIARLRYPEIEAVDHVHHAGNSSGVVDGAAAVLVGSRSFGERSGLAPRARIAATGQTGSDPTIMLTGPIRATKRLLNRTGLALTDIDLFEVNEAFAAIPLHYMQEFSLDPAIVNINGGAIAMGHPLGATGAMILGTALDELERMGGGLALVSLCVAGGMGTATLIDRKTNV